MKLERRQLETGIIRYARAHGFNLPDPELIEAQVEQRKQQLKAGGKQVKFNTNIADLWTPDIWIQAAAEPVVARLMLLNSGIVARNPLFDQIASGGGTTGNLPNFREPDPDDEPQDEGSAPTSNGLSSGQMVVPILNRVMKLGAGALAAAVSDSDPIGYIGQTIGAIRLRNRERTLLNILNGFFDTAATANDNAIHTEDGNNATADNMFDADAFAEAVEALGENIEDLTTGAIVVHSTVHTGMIKADDIDFIRDSEGRIVMRTYRGVPLFINDRLTRDGTTSGSVFQTYIFAPGAVAMGMKPQSNLVGDVASLQRKTDEDLNNVFFIDRNRFLLHPSRASWDGTPAGQSATNTELATGGNWSLDGDAKNIGIVRVTSNG